MFIIIYGVRVIRSVLEEKNNRVVEIIISSVKPFELMMGKIWGYIGRFNPICHLDYHDHFGRYFL